MCYIHFNLAHQKKCSPTTLSLLETNILQSSSILYTRVVKLLLCTYYYYYYYYYCY